MLISEFSALVGDKKEMMNIRNNSIFHPLGINVNYYKMIDKNTLAVKTYEKGIEKIMDS